MKKYISIAMAVLLLAGCVSPKNETRVIVTKKRDLTEQEKKVIEDSVKDRLKDPESAMFRMPQVNEDGKPDSYCGLVNAKNSYGGYTGYEPFMATLARENGNIKYSFPMLAEPTRVGFEVMMSMCKDYGYDL